MTRDKPSGKPASRFSSWDTISAGESGVLFIWMIAALKLGMEFLSFPGYGGATAMEEMVRFSVSMPESLVREFDRWIEEKNLKNRSDALRQIIRDYIGQAMWEGQEGETYGTFTFSYDHHSRDSSREITRLQHDFGESIVCTTHVHIDHHTCMEVVLLKGSTRDIHRFVEAASSLGCIKVGLPSLLPPI